MPWLCNPASEVSAHYYVCRDATIYQLVDDAQAAWHAGVAQAAFTNPHSIGIECEHHAGQDWPMIQKNALGWLLRTLAARYAIQTTAIETHGQVAIKGPYDRKHDPTDWTHIDVIAWRDQLFAPAVYTTVTAGPYGAIAQQARRTAAAAARYYPPGTKIQVDDLTGDYFHTADQAGFIPAGQVVA